MRILITNDDGIYAAQLVPLVKWAQKYGQVTVVAPKVEQSGKSHGIEIHKSFSLEQVELVEGVEAYALDSTPADCVRYAILGMKRQFDLVVSGINRGLNIGADIMYSGTVGAVCEAANLGVKAIAFSTSPAYYGEAVQHLDNIYNFIVTNRLFDHCDLYNVNIPGDTDVIRITHQGGPYYSDDFPHIGNDLYRPTGYPIWEDQGDDTLDTDATLHGYISITPLTTNKTNLEVYQRLSLLSQ